MLIQDLLHFLEKPSHDAPEISLRYVSGDKNARFSQILPPEEAAAGCLAFVANEKTFLSTLEKKPAVIVAKNKIFSNNLPEHITFFEVDDLQAAIRKTLMFVDDKKQRFESGIHKTAVIAKSASIGKNVSIGAYTTIGDNAQIQDNVIIGNHCVVESLASVGEGSLLHPMVFVGSRCLVGKHCEIHPHTTIGSDGFGYMKKDSYKKIPQVGNVVIHDHVEIGANCAIDRATMSSTVIGEGTKMDNLCHIAHNAKIGKNCALAGGFMIAGSSVIGDNFTCGGSVSIGDHVHIADNVTLGGRSAVTSDIVEPGVYTGFPLEPMKDGLRTMANIRNLTQIRRDVEAMKKKIDINS